MTGRIVQLDVLRAVAVLLVMGRHLMVATGTETGPVIAAVTQTLQRGGWIGVDVFFVLSGFLVSGLLFHEYQRTDSVHPGRFLIRRGFKIYPPYYVLMLAMIVVGWDALTWKRIFVDAFFFQNYSTGFTQGTWSLATEEHFYLLLAGLTWCLVRWSARPFRWIPGIWATAAVGCLLIRVSLMDHAYRQATHLFPTHLRIDALLFGVLLAYWWHCGTLQARSRPWSRRLCVLGIVLLAPPFVTPIQTPWVTAWGLTVNYLGAGAILIGLLGLTLPSRAPVRWLAFLGAHSYSIFLWHMVVNFGARAFLPVGWFLYFAVYVIGSLAVGVLMTKLVEQPALAFRDRYFPARSRTIQTGRAESQPAGATVAAAVSR